MCIQDKNHAECDPVAFLTRSDSEDSVCVLLQTKLCAFHVMLREVSQSAVRVSCKKTTVSMFHRIDESNSIERGVCVLWLKVHRELICEKYDLYFKIIPQCTVVPRIKHWPQTVRIYIISSALKDIV